MLHAAACPLVSWTSLVMLYQITAYSFDTARCRALRMRRTCRHIMHVMHTGYTVCDSVTRSTRPPSAAAARSTPPRSPRSRFSPLAAVAPEPASCRCICGWNCCCVWLLLIWLLHLILHQQPSVCRGALLRCGFVAVAFVFAAVHRRNVLASSTILSFCIFLCMRAVQVVPVPARRGRRRGQ
jgi:hypothetical protein